MEQRLRVVRGAWTPTFGTGGVLGAAGSPLGLLVLVELYPRPSFVPWQGKEGRNRDETHLHVVPGDGGRPWLLEWATRVAGQSIKATSTRSRPFRRAGRWTLGPTRHPGGYEGGISCRWAAKGSGLADDGNLCAVVGGGAMSVESAASALGQPARPDVHGHEVAAIALDELTAGCDGWSRR